MGQEKQNPSEAGRASHASKGSETENHPKRLRRYSKAKNKALANLREVHNKACAAKGKQKNQLVSAHDKLTQCGDFLKFRNYFTVDKVRLVKANFCKQHLLCPLCAIRRASKMLTTYVEKINFLMEDNEDLQASMVTLTVKDRADLKEGVEHLQGGMKKMSQTVRDAKRRKKIVSEFGKILGYAGAIEITKGKGSGLWHPHIHMIVLHEQDFKPSLDDKGNPRFAIIRKGKRKGQKQIIPALADEWQEMVGDSFIVDVQPIRNPDNIGADLVEVFKYALKFSSMKPADVVDAWLTLSGKRLVVAGGLLWGLKITRELTDTPLDELPFIELLYRFLPGAGGTHWKKPLSMQGAKMLDTIYGAKLKDGEKTFWDVYRLLMEDGKEIDRRFMGYGQGLNPESAIADCLRLELGTLQEDRARLKAGTLPVAEIDD